MPRASDPPRGGTAAAPRRNGHWRGRCGSGSDPSRSAMRAYVTSSGTSSHTDQSQSPRSSGRCRKIPSTMSTASSGAVTHRDPTGASRATRTRSAGSRWCRASAARPGTARPARAGTGNSRTSHGRSPPESPAPRVALRTRPVESVDRRAEHRGPVLGEHLGERVREDRLPAPSTPSTATSTRPPRKCSRTSSRSSRNRVVAGVMGSRTPPAYGQAQSSYGGAGCVVTVTADTASAPS